MPCHKIIESLTNDFKKSTNSHSDFMWDEILRGVSTTVHSFYNQVLHVLWIRHVRDHADCDVNLQAASIRKTSAYPL